jgi:putative tricarboxylic transport membrane protein
MQSAITRDKMSALVLLAASTAFGVLANNMSGLANQPDAEAASAKLFLAFAVAGSLIALLMLLSPGKDDHHPSGPPLLSTLALLAGLGVLVAGYALTLETLGFLIATSLFLALGYLLLGERRWWPVLLTSVPVALVLEILIYGVFGIAFADPLLRVMGFSA